jgi:hypothetical protein
MKDLIRKIFNIRTKRKALPTSEKPDVGSVIVRRGLRIKVTESIDPELWDWMLLVGWRANNFRKDRRHYTDLPNDTLSKLKAAGASEREIFHSRLLRSVKTQ